MTKSILKVLKRTSTRIQQETESFITDMKEKLPFKKPASSTSFVSSPALSFTSAFTSPVMGTATTATNTTHITFNNHITTTSAMAMATTKTRESFEMSPLDNWPIITAHKTCSNNNNNSSSSSNSNRSSTTTTSAENSPRIILRPMDIPPSQRPMSVNSANSVESWTSWGSIETNSSGRYRHAAPYMVKTVHGVYSEKRKGKLDEGMDWDEHDRFVNTYEAVRAW